METSSKFGKFITFKKCSFEMPSSWCVLACLCFVSTGFSMVVVGFLGVVVPEIEKQFGLTSTQSGFIASCQDISYCLIALIVSYVAGRRNSVGGELRWIGGGTFIMALGCLTFILPLFFFKDKIETYSEAAVKCRISFNDDINSNNSHLLNDCLFTSKNSFNGASLLFYAGYLLVGFGSAPIFTLGPLAIDRRADSDKRSLHLGLFYLSSIIGPAIGYFLGKPFLGYYVYSFRNNYLTNIFNDSIITNTNFLYSINEKSPNWIGAWWLCYVFSACFLLLSGIPLMYFDYRTRKVLNTYFKPSNSFKRPILKSQNSKESKNSESVSTISRVPFSYAKSMLNNKGFCFLTLATTLSQLLIAAFSTFLPKYMENQFSITSGQASLMAGFVIIPGGGLGAMLGGYLIRRFNLNVKQTTLFTVIASFITFLLLPVFLVGCSPLNFVKYPSDESHHILNSTCSKSCYCDVHSYVPVCHEPSKISFMNPCLAGCGNFSSDLETFSNCNCIIGTSNLLNISIYPNVKRGRCSSKCSNMYLFAFGLFLINFFLFLTYVPTTEITLKCVHPKKLSMAFGIQQFMQRLFGQIPGPLILGKIIDLACNLWNIDKCTHQDSYCLKYDVVSYRYYLFGMSSFIMFLSTIFMYLSYRNVESFEYTEPSNYEDTKIQIKTLPTI